MKIGSNEINIDGLPRALVGGLKPESVEELLNRIRWDYSQLQFECQQLREAAEQPAARQVEQPSGPKTEPARLPEPAANVETVEARQTGAAATIEAQQPEVATPTEPPPVERAPRREPDELARLALAAAHRAARELRESARRDGELTLKKVRARAVELERNFERSRSAYNAELAELDAMMREMREQMRSALRTIVPVGPSSVPAGAPESDRRDGPERPPAPDPAAANGDTAAVSGPAPFARSER